MILLLKPNAKICRLLAKLVIESRPHVVQRDRLSCTLLMYNSTVFVFMHSSVRLYIMRGCLQASNVHAFQLRTNAQIHTFVSGCPCLLHDLMSFTRADINDEDAEAYDNAASTQIKRASKNYYLLIGTTIAAEHPSDRSPNRRTDNRSLRALIVLHPLHLSDAASVSLISVSLWLQPSNFGTRGCYAGSS